MNLDLFVIDWISAIVINFINFAIIKVLFKKMHSHVLAFLKIFELGISYLHPSSDFPHPFPLIMPANGCKRFSRGYKSTSNNFSTFSDYLLSPW